MMKTITTLGCCDSGLGGMITVHALHKAYPKLNIVFIADQMNAPYGEKTLEQLSVLADRIFWTFESMNIQDVLVACNTLCCNGTPYARELHPNLNIHTIIEPTYEQLRGYDFKTINVLATNKTIETHVYKDALTKMFPNSLIREIKASKIVPIIENGFDESKLIEAVQEYCKEDADAWILGCTHYPLIRPYMNTNGMIFDSIQPIIDSMKDVNIEGEGKVTIYTTKNPQLLKDSIQHLLGCEYDVQYIDLKQS